jgi:hypothetical protein
VTKVKVTGDGPVLTTLDNGKEGEGMATKAKTMRNAMKNRTCVRVFVITIDAAGEE